jgi:hypothetical protein
MTVAAPSVVTRVEVEDFLYHEAAPRRARARRARLGEFIL